MLVDEAATPLGMLLDDSETDVQIAAAEALGEIGNDEAERILTRLVRETAIPEFAERGAGCAGAGPTAGRVDARRRSR